MDSWDKERLRLKLGLLIGGSLIGLTYLLQHYAERRQRLAVQAVDAAELRAIKRDKAQARREEEERRRNTHPVVNLLDDRLKTNPNPFKWGAAEETAFQEIAQAPEAARDDARESLRKALAAGRTAAAGPLWHLERNSEIIQSLAGIFADSRKDAVDRAAAAFILGLTADPAAFAVLRAEYRNAFKDQDQAYQVVLARALYRERQDLEYQRFLQTVAAREEPPNADDPPPSQLARQALKEMGISP